MWGPTGTPGRVPGTAPGRRDTVTHTDAHGHEVYRVTHTLPSGTVTEVGVFGSEGHAEDAVHDEIPVDTVLTDRNGVPVFHVTDALLVTDAEAGIHTRTVYVFDCADGLHRVEVTGSHTGA